MPCADQTHPRQAKYRSGCDDEARGVLLFEGGPTQRDGAGLVAHVDAQVSAGVVAMMSGEETLVVMIKTSVDVGPSQTV